MKKAIFNLTSMLVFSKRDVKVYSFTPKEEQHPQSVKLFSTATPDGKPMNKWIEGGWNDFLHKS
ncbi:MAG: hypothetical protein ABIP51_05110 [Bacteroidia bacterium]